MVKQVEALMESAMKPEQIYNAIRERYAEVAEQPVGQFKYPVGRESAKGLEYRRDFLDRIPSVVVEHVVGVGNPFSMGAPEPGWNVLDIGCGCGFDLQMAALYVGPTGRVRGVDMSPDMLRVARAGLEEHGLLNVEFIEGRADDLPVDSDWADLVISNGVLNLATCKASAFAEVARVLKPGGRFQAADLVRLKVLPQGDRDDRFAWSN
jgi:SAM-dependent methyltransferase